MHDAATVPVPMIVEEGGRKKVVELREPKGKGKATCPKDPEAELGESSLSPQRLGGRCSVSGCILVESPPRKLTGNSRQFGRSCGGGRTLRYLL